ncbi:hypothetical protein AB0E69_35130 [Kribbella sp. NPDC026611]|uniref:hypothetical protein n=1 Tax=Kribbella sp. NPDC026611 TaxID=3154911 RepID=UPI0033F79B75
MDTIAVYANRKLQLLYTAGCALFALVGVVMFFDGRPVKGLLVLVAFAAGAVLTGSQLVRPKPLLELTPAGLRPTIGGVVPWQDVEDVGFGILTGASHVVGVRLSTYTGYLQSLPANPPTKNGRILSLATRFIAQPAQNDPTLNRLQKERVALLTWSRNKTGGLDIYWPKRLLPDTTVAQIRAYQADVLNT